MRLEFHWLLALSVCAAMVSPPPLTRTLSEELVAVIREPDIRSAIDVGPIFFRGLIFLDLSLVRARKNGLDLA